MIAFATESAITEVLTEKLFRAAMKYDIRDICLAGGVSANKRLKERITEQAKIYGYGFLAPIKNLYSMDNAAMIGIRAYYSSRSP